MAWEDRRLRVVSRTAGIIIRGKSVSPSNYSQSPSLYHNTGPLSPLPPSSLPSTPSPHTLLRLSSHHLPIHCAPKTHLLHPKSSPPCQLGSQPSFRHFFSFRRLACYFNLGRPLISQKETKDPTWILLYRTSPFFSHLSPAMRTNFLHQTWSCQVRRCRVGSR